MRKDSVDVIGHNRGQVNECIKGKHPRQPLPPRVPLVGAYGVEAAAVLDGEDRDGEDFKDRQHVVYRA